MIYNLVKILIVILLLFYSHSIQQEKSYVLNFDLYQKILDIKILNGDTIYVYYQNLNNQPYQYQMDVYNITKTQLIFIKRMDHQNYNLPTNLYIDQNNGIIGGYSNISTTFSRIRINDSVNLPYGIVHFQDIQKFQKILISKVNNMVFGITTNRKLFYSNSITEFPFGILTFFLSFEADQHVTSTIKLSLDQQFIAFAYQYQLSPTYKSTVANIQIFDLRLFSFTKYISLNEGDYKLISYCWNKDSSIIYYTCENYNQTTLIYIMKLCMILLKTDTNNCIILNKDIDSPIISFQQSIQRVFLHSRNKSFVKDYSSSASEDIIIQYHNISTLQLIQSRNYPLLNKLNQTQFFSIQNKIVYYQRSEYQIVFHTITNCNLNQYYDTYTRKCEVNSQITQEVNTENEQTQFKDLLNITLNNTLVKEANKFPRFKAIFSPISSFIESFDQFILYNYHDTEYNVLVKETFQFVGQMGQQKWHMLSLNQIWQSESLKINGINNYFSTKLNYSQKAYKNYAKKSNEFYLNVRNFLFPTIIVTSSVFFFLKFIIFKLNKLKMFKNKIPDNFFLTGNIFMMLLQGNVQFLCYFVGFELKMLFHSNMIHRLLTSGVILFFFFFFIFCSSSFYLFIWFYGNKAGHFYDNFKLSIFSGFYLIISNDLRHITLAFVHILIDSSYKLKILTLIIVEIFFLVCSFWAIYKNNKKKFIQSTRRIFFQSFFGFFRLLLVSTFILFPSTSECQKMVLKLNVEISILILQVYLWSNIVNFAIETIYMIIQNIFTIFKKFQKKSIKIQKVEKETQIINQKSRSKKGLLQQNLNDNNEKRILNIIYRSAKIKKINANKKKIINIISQANQNIQNRSKILKIVKYKPKDQKKYEDHVKLQGKKIVNIKINKNIVNLNKKQKSSIHEDIIIKNNQ